MRNENNSSLCLEIIEMTIASQLIDLFIDSRERVCQNYYNNDNIIIISLNHLYAWNTLTNQILQILSKKSSLTGKQF